MTTTLTLLDGLNHLHHRRHRLIGRLKSWPFEGLLTAEWHEALDELAEVNTMIGAMAGRLEG